MTEAVASANPNAVEDRFQSLYDKGAFEPSPKPETAAPVAAAPEPVAEDTAIQGAPEPEQPDYVNVEDYLQKAGIERDSFFQLPVRVKVDGQESDVALADVLKAYQLEKHVQAKSITIAEQQKAWEAEQVKAKTALEANLSRADTLGKLARQQLMAQYQGIDWNKLRVEDPAQWAVLNTEFNQRAGAIDLHLAEVAKQQETLAQEAQQKRLDAIPKERERMYEIRPEWRDEKVFQTARGDMSSYAKKLGFTDAEIGNIFDHRYMAVLHDAARYAALQAQNPAKLKQVRAAPQMSAPGARIARDPAAVAAKQSKERFLKNPRDQDAAVDYFGRLAS